MSYLLQEGMKTDEKQNSFLEFQPAEIIFYIMTFTPESLPILAQTNKFFNNFYKKFSQNEQLKDRPFFNSLRKLNYEKNNNKEFYQTENTISLAAAAFDPYVIIHFLKKNNLKKPKKLSIILNSILNLCNNFNKLDEYSKIYACKYFHDKLIIDSYFHLFQYFNENDFLEREILGEEIHEDENGFIIYKELKIMLEKMISAAIQTNFYYFFTKLITPLNQNMLTNSAVCKKKFVSIISIIPLLSVFKFIETCINDGKINVLKFLLDRNIKNWQSSLDHFVDQYLSIIFINNVKKTTKENKTNKNSKINKSSLSKSEKIQILDVIFPYLKNENNWQTFLRIIIACGETHFSYFNNYDETKAIFIFALLKDDVNLFCQLYMKTENENYSGLNDNLFKIFILICCVYGSINIMKFMLNTCKSGRFHDLLLSSNDKFGKTRPGYINETIFISNTSGITVLDHTDLKSCIIYGAICNIFHDESTNNLQQIMDTFIEIFEEKEDVKNWKIYIESRKKCMTISMLRLAILFDSLPLFNWLTKEKNIKITNITLDFPTNLKFSIFGQSNILTSIIENDSLDKSSLSLYQKSILLCRSFIKKFSNF